MRFSTYIGGTFAVALVLLAGPAFAQTTVDITPLAEQLLNLVGAGVLALVGGVLAVLTPISKRFLGAQLTEMGARRVEEAVYNGVEAAKAAALSRVDAISPIDVRNEMVADVANYVLEQVPFWLTNAGMDREALERFVGRRVDAVMAQISE